MSQNQLKRIAFCTPVSPVESGISDYSEELLPELGRYFDITVIVDDDVTPANPELVRHLPVERIGKLQKLHRRSPFDAILYHIGNSPYHVSFYDTLPKLPGVVVLHDYVLHHMFAWRAANTLKNVEQYSGEIVRRYGEASLQVAKEIMMGRNPVAAFDYPFCEDVVQRAEGLIAHSRYVAERVERIRPGLPVAAVPMGVPLPPQVSKAEARERLGLPRDALIWASFGHVNPFKRLESALHAFRHLRSRRPEAQYVLVGGYMPSYDIGRVIRGLGLSDVVQLTGHVSSEQFQDYIAAADLCINLRHPTGGETSASLLRLLGAGRPVLTSNAGAFAELPSDVAAKVDTDECEENMILGYGWHLAQNSALADELGRRARAYIAGRHTLQNAARGYASFLARLYNWQEPQPVRDALWQVAVGSATSPATPGGQAQPADSPHLVSTLVGAAATNLGLKDTDVSFLDRAAARLQGL